MPTCRQIPLLCMILVGSSHVSAALAQPTASQRHGEAAGQAGRAPHPRSAHTQRSHVLISGRTRRAPTSGPTVTQLSLSPGQVTAGSAVTGTLELAASKPVAAKTVGIAVRDAAGRAYDYPGAASVSLGTSTYTFVSGARTFAPGTYRAFGFWRDAAGVYHNLPSIAMTVTAPAAPPVPNGIPGAWTLQQADEFNAASLDSTKWQAGWFGAGVTSPANSGEQACYDSRNVSLPGDGALHLKVTGTPSTCGGSIRPNTGALISSNPSDGRASGGYQYTYGALEARVYIPASGPSIANWPAVWTDGQSWPTTGEDDVMEGLSGQACFHFHSSSGGPGACAAGSYTGWHTFASDWEPGSVTYYYDGLQVGQITLGITAAPRYLILDNTVAAAIGGPTVLAADMQVDYVRVWQH